MPRWIVSVLLFLPFVAAAEDEKIETKKFLVVIPGDLPIILSAPHGGRTPVPGVPVRQGKGIDKFVIVRDDNTLEITLALADALEKKFGARPHVIAARFERKFVDVNRPADAAFEADAVKPLYEAYHAALDDACKKVQKDWGRGLLLDIHGQAADAEAIYRGTADGKSVTLLVQRYGTKAIVGEKSLLGTLEAQGYKVLPGCQAAEQKETKFNGGHIVRTYGSHTGQAIDAIQLELGTALRAKTNHEKLVGDLTMAVQTFAQEYLPARKRE